MYKPLALIRGAGDVASGVALRLYHAGFAVVMTEIPRPTVVRRTVSFAEAVYEGYAVVEGVEAVLVPSVSQVAEVVAQNKVAVIVDPQALIRKQLHPVLLVDAIMAKCNLGTSINDAPAVIALGPGFVAGKDAHAVVETMRGHTLGRVIWQGSALPNTGIPAEIGGFNRERVLRSPQAGIFQAACFIGDKVTYGQVVGYVDEVPVRAQLAGVLRGLARSGLEVTEGFKLGDIDPRADREHCFMVSDKALAIAGGVLEAACSLLGGVRFAV